MKARSSATLITLMMLFAASAVGASTKAEDGATAAAAGDRVHINCLSGDFERYRPKTRPQGCTVFGPGGISAGGVLLKKIHWKSWGGKRARADAIECGFHLPCQDIPAKVKASRPRERCGRTVYTQLTVKTRFGKATPSPPGCPRPAF